MGNGLLHQTEIKKTIKKYPKTLSKLCLVVALIVASNNGRSTEQ